MLGARKDVVSGAVAFIVLAIAACTGYAGVDFGRHWDEEKIVRSVASTVRTGIYLPRWYNYPSASYDLALLSALPEIARSARAKQSAPDEASRRAVEHRTTEVLTSTPYLLRVRTVFLSIVLLSVVWTYVLVLEWRGDPIEALLAAILLASSWEVAYHARWIAPDGIFMQLGVLTVLTAIMAMRRSGWSRRAWLGVAAASAGLSFGTKYYGGILIVPVLIAWIASGRRSWSGSRGGVLAEGVALVAIFAAVFVLTTPAIVATPDEVLADVIKEIRHYRSGHPGYTVEAGLEHAGLTAQYLSLAGLSRFAPLALLLAAFAVVGLWLALRSREDRLYAAVFLVTPAFLLIYLSLQRVMIVRNYLVALPFMAILAARGVMELGRRMRRPLSRVVLVAVVTGVVLLDLVWLGVASASIAGRQERDPSRDLMAYLSSRQERRIYLSRDARALVGRRIAAAPRNVVPTPEAADEVILVTWEIKDLERWSANRPGRYQVVSGSWEVNLDYYPSWGGDPKLVAIDASAYSRMTDSPGAGAETER